ncbi:PH domain-containing protein [Rhodococcus sp. ARC_M6]|uniref:PH domain-containing protein n=1 Tax=Rhodococcus sp. ARC_M6 TaxID=2928852 RepID=UPI001FB3EEB4|nr:PH domain-containing protein [Rhodococcus sp. ARC_M6]MCJ0904496.1 PH domain-containing protein [Rhodococcus sp. ARC_M6]
MSAGTSTIYEDRTLRIDNQGVTIRHYYFPFVSKFVPYSQIESVDLGIMSWLSGRLRIWGTTDFSSWYSLDLSRQWKETAVVLTLTGRVTPSFSPKDADRVDAEIRSRIGSHTQN